MSNSKYNASQQVARGWVAITPSDSVNLPDTSVVVCTSAGNASVVDQYDTALTFTAVSAGYQFPALVKRVNAAGTTANVARLLT